MVSYRWQRGDLSHYRNPQFDQNMPGDTTLPRMISAVLPLRISGRNEDLRRSDILLGSLSHFAESELFRDFFIVVPSREQRFLRSMLQVSTSLPITVVSEEDMGRLFFRRPLIFFLAARRTERTGTCLLHARA
jgi:Family of unknown function (DUF6492)